MEQYLNEIIRNLNEQNGNLSSMIFELKNEISKLKEEINEIKTLTVASSPIISEDERKEAFKEYSDIKAKKQVIQELPTIFK